MCYFDNLTIYNDWLMTIVGSILGAFIGGFFSFLIFRKTIKNDLQKEIRPFIFKFKICLNRIEEMANKIKQEYNKQLDNFDYTKFIEIIRNEKELEIDIIGTIWHSDIESIMYAIVREKQFDDIVTMVGIMDKFAKRVSSFRSDSDEELDKKGFKNNQAVKDGMNYIFDTTATLKQLNISVEEIKHFKKVRIPHTE